MDEEDRLKRIEKKIDTLIKKDEIIHTKYEKLKRHTKKDRYNKLIYG